MTLRRGMRFMLACCALACAAQQPGDLDRLLMQGAALSRQGDYAGAIRLLKEAVNLAPRNAAANYQLGVALLQSGHAADAVAPLRLAAGADPANETAYGYLGDAEMELNDFPLAAESFHAAMAHTPDSERALVWWTEFSLERYRTLEFSLRASARGRAALLQVAADDSRIDAEKRLELLQEALALDPQLPGIEGELGVAQAILDKQADAQANLNAALQHEMDAASTLELRALLAAEHGDWNGADGDLSEVRSRSPDEFQRVMAEWPRRLLPGSDAQDGVWQCLRGAQTACLPAPDSTRNQQSIPPRQLFAEGRWEQLAAAPAPATTDSAGWYWRGVALARLGRCADAIPALERGLKSGAEPDAAHLADCYEREAIHAADHLQTLGKEASIHQIRGDILLSIRLDARHAVDEYTLALKLRPGDAQLLEKLAEAFYSEGEMAQAHQAAQQALDRNPHRARLLRLLAQITMAERDYTGALHYLGSLATLAPDDAWVRVQQATAYAQTSQPENAVNALKPALDAGYPDERGSLHALLAAQLRKLGRDEEAKQASAEAIRLADAFAQMSPGQQPGKPQM